MKSLRILDESALIREFWQSHPDLPADKIRNYSGNGTMFRVDTRCAFSDFVDMLAKNGEISQELAQSVTLSD